jgi:hypothetical protein
MATQEIISSLDEYIDRLKKARDLIASLYALPVTNDHRPMKKKSRTKRQSIEVAVQPADASEVAVRVIPPRALRQRRYLTTPVSQPLSALGGPIPKEPIVIRSSELARMRSASNLVGHSANSHRPATSGGALEELAQEVAQLLASGGRFLQ